MIRSRSILFDFMNECQSNDAYRIITEALIAVVPPFAVAAPPQVPLHVVSNSCVGLGRNNKKCWSLPGPPFTFAMVVEVEVSPCTCFQQQHESRIERQKIGHSI